MGARVFRKELSSFQLIISGFGAVILAGALLLMLPVSSGAHSWTSLWDALFTSVSAVCVTGLVVRDTATHWSVFGQAVILVLIQTGGLGIVSVTAFLMGASGKRPSLLQRSLLQESFSAHQIGGVVTLNVFIFRTALLAELAGALMMMPSFCREFGAKGVWMSVFHSVSAFCNAGFDLMGGKTGAFSSLTFFRADPGIVLPVSLLIVAGGLGFLTWQDIAVNRHRFRSFRMQSKAILCTTAALILIPAVFFFFVDFSVCPLPERLCLSVFQAVTPRTAGFNTADMSALTDAGRMLTIILMLIGGSPGSTAGGVKTTTAAVLAANTAAAARRRKYPRLFGRRIEEGTIKTASALLVLYLFNTLAGAFVISLKEGLPIGPCLFETASAIGTVGLSMGITPSLGRVSRLILMSLMFFGRVGGLTLLYAALRRTRNDEALYPAEKIAVG